MCGEPDYGGILEVGTFGKVSCVNSVRCKRMDIIHAEMAQKEYLLMIHLYTCPNIINTLGVEMQEQEICLFMEDGGSDLFTLLPRIEGKDKFSIFFQVRNAIMFMHSVDVAHLDIKLENVVMNSAGYVRVIDFGFSLYMDSVERLSRTLSKKVGSLSYCAPEILSNYLYNGVEADIWSFGVFVFVLWFSFLPWDTASRRCRNYVQFSLCICPPRESLMKIHTSCNHQGAPNWVWFVIDSTLLIDVDTRVSHWETFTKE